MAQVPHEFILCDKDFNELVSLQRARRRQWSRWLNNPGQAYFEVSQDDPVWGKLNSKIDFKENLYKLKIKRAGTEVFRGTIDGKRPSDRYKSNMNYVGMLAYSRLQDFSSVLIVPDSGSTTYERKFSGTALGSVVSTLLSECKIKSNSPLSDIQHGTIENPLDKTGVVINLGTSSAPQSLYLMDLLAVVNLLAEMGNADYYVDDTTGTFYFLKNKGSRKENVVFRYVHGATDNNVSDYSVSTSIYQVMNNIVGSGSGDGTANTTNTTYGRIVQTVTDGASQTAFKLREAVEPERALENATSLASYLNTQLSKNKKPVEIPSIALRNFTSPFDGWDLGDTVHIRIKRGIDDIDVYQRILGISTFIDEQDVETLHLHWGEEKT